MANQLDEKNPVIEEQGRQVQVIDKQLPVEKDPIVTAIVFGIMVLGAILIVIGILTKVWQIAVVGAVIVGIVFWKLNSIKSYFQQIEQRIQADASEIDNYLEQRVIILQNVKPLIDTAIELDSKVFTDIARLRSGQNDGQSRNELAENLDQATRSFQIAFERYPDLRAHGAIADAMQQNSYLQKEITAARTKYNNTISAWNREIFEFPLKKYVAAKQGYTTRIPFIASQNVKNDARGVFF